MYIFGAPHLDRGRFSGSVHGITPVSTMPPTIASTLPPFTNPIQLSPHQPHKHPKSTISSLIDITNECTTTTDQPVIPVTEDQPHSPHSTPNSSPKTSEETISD